MRKISKELIQYVIIAALNDEQFFLSIKNKVNSDCFALNENLEETAWKTLIELYEKLLKLPDKYLYKTKLIDNLEKTHSGYNVNELNLFLNYVENETTDTHVAKEFAFDWFVVRRVLENLINKLNNLEPVQANAAFDKAIEEINSLRFLDNPVSSIFQSYNSRFETFENIVPLGVPFLDSKLGGGLLPHEVLVLLGPTNVGKTALSVQIACSAAKEIHSNGRKGKVVYVTYEDEEAKITERIIAFMASIPRSRLMKLKDLTELDRKHPSPGYEHLINSDYPPEYERFNSIRWIEDHLTILDFSGRSDKPTVGCGGFDEIVATLKARNEEYKLIIVDWLGVMLNRYLSFTGARNLHEEKIRHLQSASDVAYRKLCKNFDAPVILVHQISGAACKSSPTKQLSFSDAEGCTTIAVSAMHCITLGTPNERGWCRMDLVKSRRNKKSEASILQLIGNFNKFVDITDDVVIDNRTRTIISKEAFNDEREARRRARLERLSEDF